MKLVKTISLALAFVMLALVFASCGATPEEDGLLPYGLHFGATYEEVKKVFEENGCEFPELKNANSNNGYLASGVYPEDYSFSHSETLIKGCEAYYKDMDDPVDDSLYSTSFLFANPMVSFSFNDEKELYEMYLFYKDSDGDIVKEIASYYNDHLGVKPIESNSNGEYVWKTSRSSYETRYEESRELWCVIIHCFEYDLDREG